jgi:hypothetical protein
MFGCMQHIFSQEVTLPTNYNTVHRCNMGITQVRNHDPVDQRGQFMNGSKEKGAPMETNDIMTPFSTHIASSNSIPSLLQTLYILFF